MKRPKRTQYQAACDAFHRAIAAAQQKAQEMDACWTAVSIAQRNYLDALKAAGKKPPRLLPGAGDQ